MNKILILKDLDYATVSSGDPIATISDLERLAQGAIAAFDQNGDIINPDNTRGNYTNVFFAVGLATDYSLTVPLPVVIDNWNRVNYQAGVKPVVQVGDTTTTAQVDTITLTGTSGTANVTVAGGLTKLVTFNTSLTQTAADFVTAHAAAYAAEGITVSSISADIFFVATVAGVPFDSPVIASTTGNLAGTIVNTIANKSAGTPLQFLTTGDYSITVLDNTFTNKYAQARNDVSGYRQTYMTEENVVDDVVVKLNANKNLLVTAVKTGNSTDGWGISISPVEEGIIINVSVSGMFEGTPIYSDGTNKSVVQVFALGDGEDVQQLEQDFSVFEGNSNSIEYPAEYFPKSLEAIGTETYDMFNILWQGTHSTQSKNKTVMNNRLVIAGPTGIDTLNDIGTILNGIFTTTKFKKV